VSKGLGKVQRFILEKVHEEPRWWAVGTLAGIYAFQEERPYTQATNDSFRRAARQLAEQDLVELTLASVPTVWTPAGPVKASTRWLLCVAAPGTEWDIADVALTISMMGVSPE
jgi:hypothetical protein